MEKNGLLKNIENFFKTTKEDIKFMENEVKFQDALKCLDFEAIKEVVKNGYSISEFEQLHGSTLIRTMTCSLEIMLSIFKKYWPKEYIKYYCEAYPRMGYETLPEPLKKELSSVTSALISTMDVLYANGADINKRGEPVQDESIMGVLLDKTKIEGDSSPFEIAIRCLDYLKLPNVIEWFTQKDDFKLNEQKGIVSTLIRLDSNVSVEVLDMLLKGGLELESYEVNGEANRYSSLHECISVGGNQTRQQKFQLLYQAATPEQKLQYNGDYEVMMSRENEINYSK